jgi:hypothetical protein
MNGIRKTQKAWQFVAQLWQQRNPPARSKTLQASTAKSFGAVKTFCQKKLYAQSQDRVRPSCEAQARAAPSEPSYIGS